MFLHDAVNDRQAKAGAFTRTFRREERFKDAFQDGRVHAVAGVADDHPHIILGCQLRMQLRTGGQQIQHVQLHAQLSLPAAHGVCGVGAEIHHHLMHLGRVGQHIRQVGGDVLFDGDGGG